MVNITRRQYAQITNLSMPLDRELVPVKEKRKVDPTAEREWRIQAAAVKAVHERMRRDKDFWYEVNLIEGAREPRRRAMAAMMGMQRGPNDLTLYRLMSVTHTTLGMIVKTYRIEFKLPGKQLTPEQEAWFAFHRRGGVPCDRVDNLQDFLKILDQF